MLHARHVFDVTNNIWLSRINVGRLIIIDGRILIRLHLVSGWYFRLSLFPFFLFLHLLELLEGAFDLNLATLSILRHGLGALLQQVDCSSLLLCTDYK